MTRYITIEEDQINLVFHINDKNQIRLVHFSPEKFLRGSLSGQVMDAGKFVEIQESGMDFSDHHGMKHTGTNPGCILTFSAFKDEKNDIGRKLEITQQYDGLYVVSHLQFYKGVGAMRAWTTLRNASKRDRHIEYVTSFSFYGASRAGEKHWKDKMRLHIPHNAWYAEARWNAYTLPELGLNPIGMYSGTKRVFAANAGTWSTSEYLPMAGLENTEARIAYLWQIEHNGSWYWEISDSAGDLFDGPESQDLMIATDGMGEAEIYFQLSGPTGQESQWHKVLHPGDSFASVPVAVAAVQGDFESAVAEMTEYRRRIRRPNADNEILPVIFNDYMNCLFGDSTTEKLLPLIDAAARAGCEYFCIDCGWYTDDNWWGGVGEWLPSEKRYPGGISIPMDYIREKGMIPGIWLEIESMGFACPLAKKLPREWYFVRHGLPVGDTRRYQLDFRNREVREYASTIIERLVNGFGVGYIKMDYNINGGAGTEYRSDSLGDGLLQHNRAYLAWLDGIFERYPDLIIENCGSGGLRMDYAMLSRHSIQSLSDQTDYMKNAAIAASACAGLTPEQCAVWSYPLATDDREAVVVNMVNAMLMRIHQSGHLAQLPEEKFTLVAEGIACYKEIRGNIKKALPIWPLKAAGFDDPWFAFGLDCGDKTYLAVWRNHAQEDSVALPVRSMKGRTTVARCIYPLFDAENRPTIDVRENTVTVMLPKKKTARIFELTHR